LSADPDHPPSPSDATRLLQAIGGGDAAAAEQLLPLVYDELHRRAGRLMAGRQAGHTLQPTALIHEAFLRLVDQDDLRVESRLHFFHVAAQAMRYVLADHARAKGAGKRGSGARPMTLDDVPATQIDASDVLAIDEALARLAEIDPQLAKIVELRFFGGLEHAEVAEVVGISLRSVERGWRVARAWLANAMEQRE
jgi:RNA polymerase sigma factor (TIGR02999 family)